MSTSLSTVLKHALGEVNPAIALDQHMRKTEARHCTPPCTMTNCSWPRLGQPQFSKLCEHQCTSTACEHMRRHARQHRMVCKHAMCAHTSSDREACLRHQLRAAQAKRATPRPPTNTAASVSCSAHLRAKRRPQQLMTCESIFDRALACDLARTFCRVTRLSIPRSRAERRLSAGLRARFARFFAKANHFTQKCLSGGATRRPRPPPPTHDTD